MSNPTNPKHIGRRGRPNAAGVILAARAVAMGLIAWVISGIVHEMGHALAVWGAGGTVVRIQPFVFVGPPHISLQGTFNTLQWSAIHIGGMLASVFTGLVLLAVIPWTKLDVWRRLSLSVSVAVFLSQSLAWVILPTLSMFGARAHDDSLKFMHTVEIPPLWMTVSMLVVVALLARAFLTKTKYVETIREIRDATEAVDRG